MVYQQIIDQLNKLADPIHRDGMGRFGINTEKVLGIRIPELRKLAKEIGRNQQLSLKLWESEIHEARILAALVGDPKKVSQEQMGIWVKSFNSWDVCDQVCSNLFDRTPYAWEKAKEWSKNNEEFVKRAGFVLMATLAVHDKKAKNESFEAFFPYIEAGANDERNFVKKAVNWAIRQIGKRNSTLTFKVIELAEKIKNQPYKSAKWITADALRELNDPKTRKAVEKKS